MNRFEPCPNSLITAEMLRQGLIPDLDEVMRIVHLDEAATGTDTAISLAIGAVCVASAGGCLALAGLSLPIVGPIVGIGLMGISAWNSRVTQRDREWEAQFLTDHPEVLTAVEQKADAGEDTHKIASALESAYRLYLDGGKPALKPVAVDGPAAESPIGESTRLGAIPVSIAAPYIPSGNPSALCDAPPEAPDGFFDIAKDLGQNPQSALIAGVPGSGKGILVSNALRHLKARHPGLTLMVIDPKADPKEAGYWDGTADVIHRFPIKRHDPDDSTAWVLSCLDQFEALPTPKLLIFDELVAVVCALKLADKKLKGLGRMSMSLGGIITQGDSGDEWVWAMGQSVNASDIGMTGGIRGNLRAIGLVSPKNIQAVEGLCSTKLIPLPIGGIDRLRELMAESPVNRAFFDSKFGEWYPTPEMQNHSGYNRDSRSAVAGHVVRGPSLTNQPVENGPPWEKKTTDEPVKSRARIVVPTRKTAPSVSRAVEIEPTEEDENDLGEMAIRAEVKRFLAANPDGSKPRNLVQSGRSPVRKMPLEDVAFILELMALEGEVIEREGTFFPNTN
jgi:hypothetical protein